MIPTASSRPGYGAPVTGAGALRACGPAILVLAALVALIAGLAFGGGAAGLQLGDAGPLARWGLPTAKLLVNLGAAGMVGGLVTALFTLRAGQREFDVALDAASIAAACFTVAAGATGFLTFVTVLNPTIDAGPQFGAQLGRFLIDTEVGRTWLITTVAGAALTVLIFAVRSWAATLPVALLAVAALVPMGTQGHSGDDAFHHEAMTALILHIIGAAVWLGGLLTIIIVRPLLERRRAADLVARYSSIALAAFVLVAVSGTVRAAIGLQDWSALLSSYGTILGVKALLLVALGCLGVWYRARLIGRMGGSDRAGRSFWRLVVFELALMGTASGAAAALARTPPPAPAPLPEAPSPAERLTGAPLPPELTIGRWLTAWNVDLLWAVIAGFAVFFYLAGVWRVRRRGDDWPIRRTIMWVAGMALLVWVTGGVINVYRDYLFSMHMAGHMLLATVVPVLLVAGAPVTLAAQAIRAREDGTRGGREWILWAVRSPPARVLVNPFVAAGLLIGSLWVFSCTDLFRWALSDHLGHQWMIVHFLITGSLFTLSLIGIAPARQRLSYPGRLLLLAVVIATHAVFGITIMLHTGLLAGEWFGAMGRTWGATPLEDQHTGGRIAWSIGAISALVLAITVAIQRHRSNDRKPRCRGQHAGALQHGPERFQ